MKFMLLRREYVINYYELETKFSVTSHYFSYAFILAVVFRENRNRRPSLEG
jgi:hypothetical protein